MYTIFRVFFFLPLSLFAQYAVQSTSKQIRVAYIVTGPKDQVLAAAGSYSGNMLASTLTMYLVTPAHIIVRILGPPGLDGIYLEVPTAYRM